MKLPSIGKKTALVTGVIVLGVIGGVSAEVNNKPSESSVKSETTTQPTPAAAPQKPAPATTQDTTPIATQPEPTAPAASTPATTPQAVTVVSYREIVIDPNTSDCEYTYSNGTTYTFHWKTPTQITVNGQSMTATRTTGVCDNTAIGSDKNNPPQ